MDKEGGKNNSPRLSNGSANSAYKEDTDRKMIGGELRNFDASDENTPKNKNSS